MSTPEQTFRVHVTRPTEVILNGKEQTIGANVYKINNLDFCKENNFMKCARCKEYFDEVVSLTEYHPLYLKCKDKDYCNSCMTNHIDK